MENNVVVPDPKDQPLTIKRLIKAGVPLNARDKDGRTALHLAALHNHPYRKPMATNTLLAAGADFNIRDQDGRTPLHLAAMQRNGFAYLATALLEGCAQPDTKDLDGLTPLDLARRVRNRQMVKTIEAFLNHPRKTGR